MDQIYTNCGFGSCEHKGTEHVHPFMNDGDSTGFPLDKPGDDPEYDEPIADSIKFVSRKDAAIGRANQSPNHPFHAKQMGRNTDDFTTGHTEAKIIQFPQRG
jgi:hypothetical protein